MKLKIDQIEYLETKNKKKFKMKMTFIYINKLRNKNKRETFKILFIVIKKMFTCN